MEQVDCLAAIMQAQKELEEKVMHYNYASMSEQDKGNYIRNSVVFCEDELHEMLHEVPFFKEWKRYFDDPAKNKETWARAREEYVDALHFFINIALALGFDAESLLAAYLHKNSINHKRQLNQVEYKPSADEN